MVSHYRLLGKIGAGGMGVVWKAQDTILDRTVAIKFLPTHHALDDQRRKMFLDEARLAASLSHGNIVQVHELGREGDLDFIVMEHVDGRPLSEILAARRLSHEQVVAYGLQLSEALSRAHRKGLIHRDLKPANLLVTPEDDLKVVDFGLATLLHGDPGTGTFATTVTHAPGDTADRAIVGSPPYMSPEQIRGEQLDARSDVFSFGSVLYEMTTGQRPFQGKSLAEVANAVLASRPTPVHDLVPNVPLDLDRIIEKAMAPRATDRYQSVDDMAVDFRRLAKDLQSGSSPSYAALLEAAGPRTQRRFPWRLASIAVVVLAALVVWRFWPRESEVQSPATSDPTATVARPDAGSTDAARERRMIVVLPFENLSPDPDKEYFADGMTEEVIAQLAKLSPERLGVIARTSAMHYKGTDHDVAQIGRELGVQYVLEGSVRHAGGRVRITAQLITVSDQTHLWAENYERDISDVFAIQGEVAGRVAESLSLELLPQQEARLSRAATTIPAAHEAYLRGRFHWAKRTVPELRKAIQYFQRAVELDSDYAEAWWGLADGWAVLADYDRSVNVRVTNQNLREASRKALELDPTLIEARAPLGMAAMYEWDWVTAERELRAVIEQSPGYATAHHWYTWLLVETGRYEQAVERIRIARRLDPLSLIINSNVGQMLYFAGRYEEALQELERCLEMDSDFRVARAFRAATLMELGRERDAIRILEELVSRGIPSDYWAWLAVAHARIGELAEAQRYLAQLQADPSSSEEMLAIVLVAVGQHDEALEVLERGCAERKAGMRTILAIGHFFEPIESHPRYQAVLRCVNLAP